MKAAPEAAVRGLAAGFAAHLGVDPERVTVTGTEPDLFSRRLAAERQLGTSLVVHYEVETPPGEEPVQVEPDAGEAGDTGAMLAEISSTLETALEEEGLTVAVEAKGVEVTVVERIPTQKPPETTSKPETPEPPKTVVKDVPDDDGGFNPMLIIGIVIVAVGLAGGGYLVVRSKGAESQGMLNQTLNSEEQAPLDVEVVSEEPVDKENDI
jgi:hypothetical protein